MLLVALLGCGVVDPAATHPIPPYAPGRLDPATPTLRVIAMGDWGTGRSSQQLVADAMALRAREQGADFVLTLGDNFYSSGVESVDDPQWEEKFTEIYSDPALAVPWQASLGNHDHKGSFQAQIDYAGLHPQRWIMPSRYYSFTKQLGDGTRVAFFVLDTTPIMGEPEQLEWLREELASCDAEWRVVCGHHPLWSSCSKPFRGPNTDMIEALQPLFVEYGVDLYLAGHDHILELRKPVDGVYHAISGAAGGPDKAYPAEWTDAALYVASGGGFLYMVFTPDELRLEFVRNQGETQFGHVVRRQAR